MTSPGQDPPRLLPDALVDVLDFNSLKDEELLRTALYRCMEMYFVMKGESGLEKILLMWDDISRRHRDNGNA